MSFIRNTWSRGSHGSARCVIRIKTLFIRVREYVFRTGLLEVMLTISFLAKILVAYGAVLTQALPLRRRCQNLSFGGPDKRTLYVAGGGTLLRIAMRARGFVGRAK